MRAIAIAALTALAACGQRAGAPTTETPSQESLLDVRSIVVARLPFIDACLARSPETRVVTIDLTSDVLLRLSGDDQTVDCVFPHDDVVPENAVITPQTASRTIENPILFVRAPGENPGGECYEAPEVRGDNGELLGWTLDPQGC
jgi:hypothetical protein